ncbi:hypothetical protein Bind_3745 (plasmid) [Beijerinckia indica subsp. indica ATCC 9039]|uniref:Uncharacterized protein n=1 Tax=Beijerinckia indica subsp. indica (strain ATCC 9039 / DSM 1715 / NCIMB 8712) TaxID=395963 RepID=B2IL95_BEII9|nr:hypothetical protein Bind_3745 [Beijerinckia indica subsp. indica ATCC 9039]
MPDLFSKTPRHDADTTVETPRTERQLQAHTCLICGKPAHFGFGVSLLHGIEGRWSCFSHREDVKRRKE